MRTRGPFHVLAAGSLGDALVTLPALQALQTLGPVTLSGTALFLRLGAAACGVEKVGPLEQALPLGPSVGRFAETYLFFKSDGEALAAPWRAAGEKVVVPETPFEDFLRRPRKAFHYWNALVEAAHPGVPIPPRPVLQAPGELREAFRRKGLSPRSPGWVLHPGSGGRAKNPPLALFRDLSMEIGRNAGEVVVTWGEAERDRLGEIKNAFDGLDRVRLLEEPLSLRELAGLLLDAKGYLGCDSGVSHLAGACGVPSFLLFGPTDPNVWAPPGATVYACGPVFGDAPGALGAFRDWAAPLNL